MPPDTTTEAPPAAPLSATPAPPSTTPPATTPPPTAPSSSAPPSIFDAVGSADPAPLAPGADGKLAKPEWLDDAFWDPVKNEARLESLARSQKDLRARISRGEGTLPEAPEGYALPSIEGMPADFVPADDPVWGEVRQAAHKAGITQAQMDALLRPYLSHAARIKAELAPPDPGQQQEQHKAELLQEIGKLGPNGPALVREVGGWIAGLESRGSLTPEEAGALREIGTAAGIRAITKLRSLAGEQAIPLDALQDDAMSEADARRMLVEGYKNGDDALLNKGRRALETLEKRGLLSTAR